MHAVYPPFFYNILLWSPHVEKFQCDSYMFRRDAGTNERVEVKNGKRITGGIEGIGM